MRAVQHETNIEILRQYTECLEQAYSDLEKKYLSLKNGLDHSTQDWLQAGMKDQLSRLQKKFFGWGRETIHSEQARQVGHSQARLLMHGERWNEVQDKAASKQTGARTLESDKAKIVKYECSAEELSMEKRLRGIQSKNTKWKELEGLSQDSVEVTITERVYQKVVHRQAKYKLLGAVDEAGKDIIVTAPGPVKLKPGCQYSVDFALSVVSDKYEFHLPLERQRRKMESLGLSIDVKTLYKLCQSVAEHCENEVLDQIRSDIFTEFCAIHLDESPWPIIGSKSSSFMWTASNRVGSYFCFEPTRSGKIAEELVEGYEGAVLTDGFAGYNRLKSSSKIRCGHCWSHARREFYERIETYPQEATRIIQLIDQLFAIEAKAKTFEELRELRRVESVKVMTDLYQCLLQMRPRFLPTEGISRAINYTLKFWKELSLFLNDLSLPLSNNDAERALRHIVMGRKNFQGSRTINGADTAATLYTVIETCKKVGLDPKDYFKYVITEHWHKRRPKSPATFSAERFGKNKRIIFPPKSDWKI